MFGNLARLAPRLSPSDAFTRFMEGLDIETPAWLVPPGRPRDCLNYEVAVEGGYRDIRGYERFDGQPKPSDASFTILEVTITGSIEVGDTVTGATSGATGLVIAKGEIELPEAEVGKVWSDGVWADGVWADGLWSEGGVVQPEPQQYLVLTKVTGTWDEDSEDITVSAVVEGNTDAQGYADSAPTPKLKAQYKNLAADAYREDIAEVPGEGSVWGGFTLEGDKYAIRNKTGGATAGLYKATASGWEECELGLELAFTSGSTEIEEGDEITGATSSATATVKRIQLVSGSWGDGDAAGYLTLADQDGTFQAENLNVGAGSNVATIAGDSEAITLAPDGRLDWDASNFADPRGPERVYGATGVDFGFEFDGEVFARVHTGMVNDKPSHVAVHKNHLFFSFDGSVQHSGTGAPFSWSVIVGAGEIATGYRITGFHAEPGAEGNATLLVCCRQRLFMLYGNDSSDWNLVRYRRKVGAYEWTIQQVAYTLFLDDRGITDLRTTQAFGNFDHSALSGRITRLLNEKRSLAVASCVVRDKNQYRLFFSDRSALYVTMEGRKLMGIMPVTLNHQVTCAWSEEDEDGKEEVFFGGDDGFVYQMERGTSFDGDNIRAYLYTHFDHNKSIEWMKMYYAPVTVEARGSGYAEFDLSYELDYGSARVSQPDAQTALVPASEGAMWDTGLAWDTFIAFDDSALVPTVGLDLRGEGRNISWIIVKDSDYFEPLLLSGVHFRYMPTVQIRG